MQPKTFSKNSIHWRLASHYGPLSQYETETDICRYTRAVVRGILTIVAITTLMGLLSAGTGFTLAYVAACFTTGIWFAAPSEVLLIPSIIVMFSAIVALAFFEQWRQDRKEKKQIEYMQARAEGTYTSSAWAEMYRSFKKKTCFRVVLQDQDE